MRMSVSRRTYFVDRTSHFRSKRFVSEREEEAKSGKPRQQGRGLGSFSLTHLTHLSFLSCIRSAAHPSQCRPHRRDHHHFRSETRHRRRSPSLVLGSTPVDPTNNDRSHRCSHRDHPAIPGTFARSRGQKSRPPRRNYYSPRPNHRPESTLSASRARRQTAPAWAPLAPAVPRASSRPATETAALA